MRSSSTAAESSSPRRARRRRTSPPAAAHTPPPPPSQLVSLSTRHYPARDTSRTGHRRLLCPNVPMPRAGLLCVVRHAHRSLRREQQRRLPLHFEVPCDEVGGLARAPRTSHLAHATFAHASRLNAARARRTLHATHPTSHAARRTPHAACRTPLLALWQIVLEERCLGQTTCMFVVNDDLFGGDPCVGKQKRYAGCHPWHSTLSTTLALARWLPPCRRAPHVHCMCACLEMHVHAQCALRVQAGCAAGMRRSSRGGDGGQGGQGQEVRPLGTRNAPAP